MHKDDTVRLRHMLDAAKEAVSFLHGKQRSVLSSDRKLALSLVRLIEVIGEAACQITKEFQQSDSDIPWSLIVGMRNRLIHAYFDIDLERVWDTVQGDPPPLMN